MTQTLAHRETYTEPELELIINRAQEIELQDRLTPTYTHDDICAAAEEMGVSEKAVIRALEEHRLRRLIGPPLYVFALKFDNYFYIAEQRSVYGSRADICYLDGTTSTIDRDLTFPTDISPGYPILVQSKYGWWISAKVINFDTVRREAKIRFNSGREVICQFDQLRMNINKTLSTPTDFSKLSEYAFPAIAISLMVSYLVLVVSGFAAAH